MCFLRFICVLVLLCLSATPALAVHRDAQMQQARHTSWKGAYAQAEALYRHIVRADPRDVEAWLGLAQVLGWQKKYAEARVVYQHVRQLRPDLPDAALGLLQLQAWEGEYPAAEAGLTALLEQHPGHFGILMLLGQVTGWRGKFRDSIGFYRQVLQRAPDNAEALQGLATTYKWMGNTRDGIPLYTQMLKADPANVQAHIDLGILYSQAGNQKKAVVSLEKARDLAPERPDIRAMLGTLYSWTARLDDAVTELQKSVSLSRGDVSGYIALGRVYSWQKNTEASIALYQQALMRDPENTEALVGLGTTYLHSNRWHEAEALYQQALAIRPQDVGAQQAMARLRKIRAPELLSRYHFFEFRNHNKATGIRDTRYRDHRETVEYVHKLSPKTEFQARYQRSDQQHADTARGVTVFDIDTNVGSIGVEQQFPKAIGLRARYDFSKFNNDGTNEVNMQGRPIGHAGYVLLSKEYQRHYVTANFGRELFISTSTGNATMASVNTYGVSYDVDVTDRFSLLMTPSLDAYSTDRGMRQDHSVRARFRLPFYEKIQLEGQFRYLSRPNEFDNSVFVNFQDQWKETFRYEIRYALAHNTLEDDLEHTATLFLTWDAAPWLSFSVDARFAIEQLADRDRTQSYQTYATLRF